MKNRKAHKDLYQGLIPLPENSPVYETNFVIKKENYPTVFLGFCPMNMEDKWFVYEENGEIFLYRSWSDICIAKLLTEKMKNGDYKIYKIKINGDNFQYKSRGKEEDIELVIESLQNIFDIQIK